MSRPFYFRFFVIHQEHCAMKVGTDSMILGSYVRPGDASHILDIGTGSGVLALMMAQNSRAMIEAIDVDEGAWKQASRNAASSRWGPRIQIHHLAVQDFPDPGHTFDLIISNPPYFEAFGRKDKDASGLSRRRARSHESLSPEALIHAVLRHLSEAGRFYLILPARTMEKFIPMAEAAGLYPFDILQIKNAASGVPIRTIAGFTRKKLETKSKEFVIRNEEGNYSEEYLRLTKDFHAFTPR